MNGKLLLTEYQFSPKNFLRQMIKISTLNLVVVSYLKQKCMRFNLLTLNVNSIPQFSLIIYSAVFVNF